MACRVRQSDEVLFSIALTALEAQQLPKALDPPCAGAHGIGLSCDLCGLPIRSEDVEIEAAVTPDGAAVRFHSQCYDQWQRACAQLLGQRPAREATLPEVERHEIAGEITRN